MNIVEAKAYKCTNCGHTYLDKNFAVRCCKPRKCEDCGCVLSYHSYKLVCDSCYEKRQYDKAVKLSPEEYEEQFRGNMVVYGDEYYSSVDECLESLVDKFDDEELMNVQYIWGTDKIRIELNYENIIIDMEENSNLEDFSVDQEGYKEMKEFLEKWNGKYGTDCYTANNVIILLTEEFKKQFLN